MSSQPSRMPAGSRQERGVVHRSGCDLEAGERCTGGAERMAGVRTFEDLVDEAVAVDVSGWDFGWLDGRATEERPPWGYSRMLAARLAERRIRPRRRHRRRRDRREVRAAALEDGRHRGVASERRPSSAPSLAARRRGRSRRARAAATLPGRQLRPRDEPPPGGPRLARDRSRARRLAAPTSPSTSGRARRSSSSSTSPVRCRESPHVRDPEREAAAAVAAGLESRTFAPRAAGWSSSTSAPSSTCCASASGGSPTSPSSDTATSSRGWTR